MVYSNGCYGKEFQPIHTTKEFAMDGNRAFEYLSKMTEDERKAVRLLWFDEEMLDSLPSVDDEKKYTGKCEFFDSLPNEEKGELIERGLYTQDGDFTKKHSEFLDDFAERFDKAIGDKMQMTTRGASMLLEQEFDSVVGRIASVSDFLANNAELNSDGDRSTNNPNYKFYVENGAVGISFIENEDERESADKPWMWWMELDNNEEYNAFATLDEAVDDFVNNIPRIEKIVK
jgi:hypothetical protein